jgi:hypothetical protein
VHAIRLSPPLYACLVRALSSLAASSRCLVRVARHGPRFAANGPLERLSAVPLFSSFVNPPTSNRPCRLRISNPNPSPPTAQVKSKVVSEHKNNPQVGDKTTYYADTF